MGLVESLADVPLGVWVVSELLRKIVNKARFLVQCQRVVLRIQGIAEQAGIEQVGQFTFAGKRQSCDAGFLFI